MTDPTENAANEPILPAARPDNDPADEGAQAGDTSPEAALPASRALGVEQSGSRLPQAQFAGAHLESSTFDRADLTEANFQDAYLEIASFKHACLLRANLSRARLTKARLQAANLRSAVLEQAELSEARLQGADLQHANLTYARLPDARLEGADLSEATLENAWLRGAVLEDAYLERTNLHGAYLGEANLRGAFLRGAILRDCKLPEAILAYANLTRADLRGARLATTDLRSANLHDANLEGAFLYKAILDNADLRSTNLRGANLQKAVLTEATLEHADVSDADLSGANLRGANVYALTLDGATFDTRTVLPDGRRWSPENHAVLVHATETPPLVPFEEPPIDREFDSAGFVMLVPAAIPPIAQPAGREFDTAELELLSRPVTAEAEAEEEAPAAPTRRVLTDLLNYLPARLLPALTSLVTLPLYTHLFSPDEFGRYVLAFGLSELLMNAAVAGFAAGAVRFFVAYKREGKLIAYFTLMLFSFGLMVGAGAGASTLLLLALKAYIPSSLYPLLWVAIPTFITASLSELLMSIVRAQERSRLFSLFEVLNRVGTVIVSLLLVFVFKIGVAGLLWGQTVTMLVTSLPLIWITTRGVTFDALAVQRAQLKQMWQFSLPLTMGYIAIWWIRMSDRYIIEAFSNSYEVGLYSVSYNIAWRSIFLLIGLFLLVPGPIMMRVWEEDGQRAAEETLRTLTRYFLLIIVPSVVGFAVLARPLVKLLTAEEYLKGYRAAWLVACAMAAQGLGELASQGAYIATRSRALARNQFLVAFINFGLNLVLIPLWGFMGAATSMLLTFGLLAYLQARVSARYLTWRWPMDTVVRVGAASAVMGLLTYLTSVGIEQLSGSSSVMIQAIAILAATGVGCVVYAVLLVVLGEISPRAIYASLRSSQGGLPAVALPLSRQSGAHSDGGR